MADRLLEALDQPKVVLYITPHYIYPSLCGHYATLRQALFIHCDTDSIIIEQWCRQRQLPPSLKAST